MALWERAYGPGHPLVAYALDRLGNALVRQGELEQARQHYERALSIGEQALGAGHPKLAYSRVGLAKVALVRRRYDAARAHAEHAVSIRERNQVASEHLAEARFVLAQALWSDAEQRPRARALAQQARAAFAEHGKGSEAPRGEVERWLAERPVR